MLLNPTSVRLEYDENANSLFSGKTEFNKSFRKLSDMTPVLLDDIFVTDENGSNVIYTMFRNSVSPEHSNEFKSEEVRYDVTVIEPLNIGRESCKTFGHYHPISEDGTNPYPEIYEVVEGQATFLLQRKTGKNVTEVDLIDATKNDKVMIPPGYGHLTINTGKRKLILANLVSSRFHSDYEPMREKHGGAVYVISVGGMIQNPHYYRVSVNRHEAAGISWMDSKSSIYDQFINSPELFSFLNSPSLLPQ